MKEENKSCLSTIVYIVGIICAFIDFMFLLAMVYEHPIMQIPTACSSFPIINTASSWRQGLLICQINLPSLHMKLMCLNYLRVLINNQ